MVGQMVLSHFIWVRILVLQHDSDRGKVVYEALIRLLFAGSTPAIAILCPADKTACLFSGTLLIYVHIR